MHYFTENFHFNFEVLPKFIYLLKKLSKNLSLYNKEFGRSIQKYICVNVIVTNNKAIVGLGGI